MRRVVCLALTRARAPRFTAFLSQRAAVLRDAGSRTNTDVCDSSPDVARVVFGRLRNVSNANDDGDDDDDDDGGEDYDDDDNDNDGNSDSMTPDSATESSAQDNEIHDNDSDDEDDRDNRAAAAAAAAAASAASAAVEVERLVVLPQDMLTNSERMLRKLEDWFDWKLSNLP